MSEGNAGNAFAKVRGGLLHITRYECIASSKPEKIEILHDNDYEILQVRFLFDFPNREEGVDTADLPTFAHKT